MKWPKRWDVMHGPDEINGSHTVWECVFYHHHYWLLAALWCNWRAR